MSRRQTEPLRALSDEERMTLSRLSRWRRAPAAQGARATALLAVAEGQRYTAAAKPVGRRNGDTVALWGRASIAKVSQRSCRAMVAGRRSAAPQQRRILAEAERIPDRARDGTATWSLRLLQKALRQAPDGLSRVSTSTIWRTLHAAGQSWQRSRTWCQTGVVARRRKHGTVTVVDPDAAVKRG